MGEGVDTPWTPSTPSPAGHPPPTKIHRGQKIVIEKTREIQNNTTHFWTPRNHNGSRKLHKYG